MTKTIITSGKQLSNIFTKYIENTDNVIIYKLGNYHIPSNIQFPNARATTLINCSKEGIFNILTPNTFPNLKKINYLSTHPGNYNVYKRFSNIHWEFPAKEYDFYNFILNNSNINSNKNKNLLSLYLKNKRIIDGQNGHDISFYFDVYIKDFYKYSNTYSLIDGEWLRDQFYEYCVKKQHEYYEQEDKELV